MSRCGVNEVYVSTGAFRTGRLEEILIQARHAGIHRIELSSGLQHRSETLSLLTRYRDDYSFLVHNYFPPPADPFTLNLASANPETIERSMTLCQDALALCADLAVPFYSIHCGFAFDSDGSHLGRRDKTILPRIPLAEAVDIFCKNLRRLMSVADTYGVPLAIENNIVDMESLVEGENRICLGADLNGLAAIFSTVDSDNLFLLLDLGHAKVNENTLGQPIDHLIDAFEDRIIAVHISDNDGTMDLNLPIEEGSTLWNHLSKIKGIRVIESRSSDLQTVLAQMELLEDKA